MLHHFIWGHAPVSDVLLLDYDNGIFYYPIDDEVLRSCTRTIEIFEGGDLPFQLCFLEYSYFCCCVGCGGIVGVGVSVWIVHTHVGAYYGTILLHGYDDNKVSIGVSFLKVVRIYTH